MDEQDFQQAADRTNLSPQARERAYLYLVGGEPNYTAVARQTGVRDMSVRRAVMRVLREYRRLRGYPENWEAVTVVLPPDAVDEVRTIERRVLQQHGLMTDPAPRR